MTLLLASAVLVPAAMAVMLLLVRAIGAPGTPSTPPRAEVPRAGPRSWPSATLRMVMVGVVEEGLLVDGIVEAGTVLGAPGTPVTLLLERAEPGVVSSLVRALYGWAELDAVVEVALVADHGLPAAAFSDGEAAVQLPILGLRT